MCRRIWQFAAVAVLGVAFLGWGKWFATHAATDEEGETLLRGIEYRMSAFDTVRCRAVFHYVLSERTRKDEESKCAADAARRQQTSSFEIQPLDPEHRNLVDVELTADRWRCELVHLTNSGQTWGALDRLPSMWRSLDPLFFYRLSLCDGQSIYEYDRSSNWGYVRPYRSQPSDEPQEIKLIRSHILAGLHTPVLAAVRAHAFEATSLGTETVAGRRCFRLQVRQLGERKRLARAWIAPDLGYASVRQEIVYFKTGSDELLQTQIVRAWDFREVVPTFWCPMLVQIDWFDYGVGQLDDPWTLSQAIQVLAFSANDPLETIVTPFRFPFDCNVLNTAAAPTQARVNVAEQARRESGGVRLTPDPLGMRLTAEEAFELLWGTRED